MKIKQPLSAAASVGSVAKGRRRMPFGLAGVCLVAGIPPLTASARSTAMPATSPTAHYCGKLLSSGRLVDVETSLQVDRQGRISGTYRFDDDETTTTGSLSEIQAGGGWQHTLLWTDRYGTGSLTIRFTSDYSHFEGLWGPQDAAPSYTWNGGECNAPVS